MLNRIKSLQLNNEVDFLSILTLLASVLILSVAAILTKLSEFDIGPSATVFNRYLIAVITLSLWQTIEIATKASPDQVADDWRIKYQLSDIFVICIESIMSLGCILLWAFSFTKTSVANSNLLHNMTPIFAILGGWLILGQHFNRRFLIGMAIALAASSSIQFQDWRINYDYFFGDSLAFMSSILYAGAFLAREKLRSKFSAGTILLWSCTFRLILSLPIVLLTEDKLFPSTYSGWLAVISLGVLVQVIGHGLLTYSLKKFSSGFVSTCLLLDPIFTAIFAWIIFSEQLSVLNCAAFLVVLIGMYLAITGKGAEKDAVE
ncbi:DMT family transporter [Plectonema radiosum NIES-515]|uniref:DMT family transporter n=1 Tax=Plectonema radiosum NIES-515 TaxID=2986073 RepID=A0ABT3B3D3_9CYAN|nr:DMT family transporter [Plectonema radiosum]MCV3215878.1 DMT family transporter [Plectonema radiosum NIES-515]